MACRVKAVASLAAAAALLEAAAAAKVAEAARAAAVAAALEACPWVFSILVLRRSLWTPSLSGARRARAERVARAARAAPRATTASPALWPKRFHSDRRAAGAAVAGLGMMLQAIGGALAVGEKSVRNVLARGCST
jgi:hypothetical protein